MKQVGRILMPEHDYVTMPQNDMAQIEQVGREYSSEPAKGIPHGVQKDAIQNSFGARAEAREVLACQNWEMNFELKRIKGREALVFWDKGTMGLTGEILSASEITEQFANGSLGPEQRLGRFLARFVSGENLGPGTFGRGKLVFHAASKTTSILIDSLRKTDGEYIALDRRVINGALKQPKRPYVGEEAKAFIANRSDSILEPLTSFGTRITILDILPEVVQTFKYSFTPGSKYKSSLAYMIEETWWEIIHKFNAQIFLRYGDERICVELHDEILGIAEANGDQEGIQTYKQKNINIIAGGMPYRIKEIKFIIMPSSITDEDLRDIWVQRKRMKIGSIARNLYPNAKIVKRLCGYLTLEPELENLIEQSEGTTHYGFNFRATGIRRIRDTVREELNKFERQLGLLPTSVDAQSRQRLLNSMKELNELAEELGLVTQQNIGIKRSDVDILFQSIQLPEEDTLRVEIGDRIGPISYKLINKSSRDIFGVFSVSGKQRGLDSVELYRNRIDFQPEDSREIEIEEFELTRDLFENGKALTIEAKYTLFDSTKVLAKCMRTLYIGILPPEFEKPPVSLTLYCDFPHKHSRRVETTEIIRNIKIKATNNSPHEIAVDLSSSVRHLENPKTGRLTTPLFELLQVKDMILKPQQDYEAFVDDITVLPDNFGSVLETPADVTERCCDIYCIVRLARASIELNKPRKWKLNKTSIKFYLEVDPPGHSIFQDAQDVEAKSEGWQSKYEGTMESGYTFYLNIAHGAYRFVESREDKIILTRYIQEQMLRKAYLIAFENDIYKGPAEQHKDALTDAQLPAKETARIFDLIIGTALNQI